MDCVSFVVVSEFDILAGANVKAQFPLEGPFLKDQLAFLSEIVIPDQMHNKAVDTEDFTLFPVYYNEDEQRYGYVRKSEHDEQMVLFTVCNYKFDSSLDRNYSIKSLSIVTRLPFFISLKPLMIMLLENYFHTGDLRAVEAFYHDINKYPLYRLSQVPRKLNQFSKLSYLRDKQIDSNKLLGNLSFLSYNKDNLELMVPLHLHNTQIKIPIRLAISSLIASDVLFFGYNLEHDMILKNFLNTLNSLHFDLNSKALCPFGAKTPAFVVLYNAILTRQKIIVMSYTKPIMNITEFILAMLLLMPCGSRDILGYNAFPYFDISKVDVLKDMDHYILGTTNPIFKELGGNDKLYDLLIDLDQLEILSSVEKIPVEVKAKRRNFSMKKFPKLILGRRQSSDSSQSSSIDQVSEVSSYEYNDLQFDFERNLYHYGDKISDDTGMLDIVQKMNGLVRNKQDDIEVYLFVKAQVELMGYTVMLETLRLTYNLTKLIGYRTWRYEMDLKGARASIDIESVLQNLEREVVERNREGLDIPYDFDETLQLLPKEKRILQYHVKKSLSYSLFLPLFLEGKENIQRVLPRVEESGFEYSINVFEYIDAVFELFDDLDQIDSTNLENCLQSLEKMIFAVPPRQFQVVAYYLVNMTKPLQIGQSTQFYNAIKALLFLQKFIMLSDSALHLISQILAKLSQDSAVNRTISLFNREFV